MSAVIVLVPAYQPDHRLLELVAAVRAHLPAAHVLVVDDGSGPHYAHLFAAARDLGATCLGYPVNRGKGHALKHGIRYAVAQLPGHDVVSVDCDGQHTVPDMLRVVDAISPRTLVLGSRALVGAVPLRSRVGNAVTRAVFGAVTGVTVRDTQTGLRGYPADLLAWATGVPGERFEYEMASLLAARRAGHRIIEVPITTIYLEQNASSHFRPVLDSIRVYLPVVRFAASSLGAFALDTIALLALTALTGDLLVSVVCARLVSAVVNFTVNRRLVFAGGRQTGLLGAATRYGLLAVGLLAAGYLLLRVLTAGLGVPLLAAKVLTDGLLLVVSYLVQAGLVFADRSGHRATARPPGDQPAQPPNADRCFSLPASS